MAPQKVAVLDDYQGVSEPHFAKLDPSQFEVSQFKDTLLPYNHPDTPQSAKDELVQRLEPFDIICTMRERTPFPEDLVNRLPNLKLLLTTGMRNKGLDLDAFAARTIPVAGTTEKRGDAATKVRYRGPGAVGTDSTTQHTVALILALARNIPQDVAGLAGPDKAAWQTDVATGLGGKTLGVVGLGRLGATTARIMHLAFGMRVIAWSPNLTQEAADAKAKEMGLLPEDEDGDDKTFKVVSKEELFSTADVVSIHVVLSDRSRGLVSATDLARMKPSSLLINTSRGPLIVEQDLLETLREGRIRGAALDVFDIEPLPADSPWRSADWGTGGRSRVVLTPHMGYVEEWTLEYFYTLQVANLERWARGEELDGLMTPT